MNRQVHMNKTCIRDYRQKHLKKKIVFILKKLTQEGVKDILLLFLLERGIVRLLLRTKRRVYE